MGILGWKIKQLKQKINWMNLIVDYEPGTLPTVLRRQMDGPNRRMKSQSAGTQTNKNYPIIRTERKLLDKK